MRASGIMRYGVCALLALVLALAGMNALAQAAPAVSRETAGLENQVQRIAYTLRCLVCQNQSIAESNAPLALDLREQVREQLIQGRSEAEITNYMVERYGDFVLYRPPLRAATLGLWLGPFVLLLAGAGWLVVRLRKRARQARTVLTPVQRQQARALLDGLDDSGSGVMAPEGDPAGKQDQERAGS
ncbi:cytochrome c-type biogenesis protein CcmH [Alcaligenaceae bacterium SJ-26]|nr:cytochrome c-type biogenesis protein CcmH [Alcaligenaceae bacterium SJ-26]